MISLSSSLTSQLSHLFSPSKLSLTIATLACATVAHGAGLERSGQDVTAFLQDGTYAEVVYTYIDADIEGHDNALVANEDYKQGNKFDDISEPYDYFRYGVKTDVNDTFSVGVLYDEPWGAAAKYTGENNFTGIATRTGAGAIQRVAGTAIDNTNAKIDAVTAALQATTDPIAQTVYGSALTGLNSTLDNFNSLSQTPTLTEYDRVIAASEASIAQSAATIESLSSAGILTGANLTEAQNLLTQNQIDLERSKQARDAVANLLSIDGNTNVEVRSNSLSLIGGMKFGDGNGQFQVYGGPVAQRIEADVKLRGDAYGPAAGYDARIAPDMDYGYLAGVSYSIPKIALKAALTYRSEIEHEFKYKEQYPIVPLLGYSSDSASLNSSVTTPESVNLDFQTGVNPTTLLMAKVRWVPWSDATITPPLYNAVSKQTYPPEGLNLLDYDEDQWYVELGLGKRLAPKVAVSGQISWDSGAGNPVSSLGPVEGYYGLGLGAKFDVTDNWAISAGGKYLWFGDADGKLPHGALVNRAEDNEGYAVGVKLSYQDK